MSQSHSPFWPLVTPVPNEFAIGVIIDKSVLVNNPNAIPTEGTPMNKFPSNVIPQGLAPEWNTYIFVSSKDGDPRPEREDGKITLIFGKNKTAAQLAVPFRSTPSTGPKSWHPILLSLELIADPNFPLATSVITKDGGLGTATAQRHIVREEYIPGAQEGTKFITDEFYAATPFNIPQHECPLASHVSYDFPGASGGFPECLHDDLAIKSKRSGVRILDEVGNNELGGALPGQFFPATNFTDWTPYYVSDDQKFIGTGYHRVRVFAIPPPQPDIILQ